jgi:hypothetical protein
MYPDRSANCTKKNKSGNKMFFNPQPKPKKKKKRKPSFAKITKEVWIRDGFQCQMCGKNIAWESNGQLRSFRPHHIVHQSQGGKWEMDNLILFCWNCHQNGAHRHKWNGEEMSKEDFMNRCRKKNREKENKTALDVQYQGRPCCL